MYWGGGLFLLLCTLLCIFCFLPVRLQFLFEHNSAWHGTVTVYFLWVCRTVQYPDETLQNDSQNHEKSTLQRKWKKSWADWRQRTSFQIQWRALMDFSTKVIRIISRRLRLETLSLQCDIGFSRPDWTAYSYGFFWTVLSILPQTWLERGTFTYTPDFQRTRQEIALQGIIRCRVGQLILMIMSLFRLTVSAMLEQKRKEQMLYES